MTLPVLTVAVNRSVNSGEDWDPSLKIAKSPLR